MPLTEMTPMEVLYLEGGEWRPWTGGPIELSRLKTTSIPYVGVGHYQGGSSHFILDGEVFRALKFYPHDIWDCINGWRLNPSNSAWVAEKIREEIWTKGTEFHIPPLKEDNFVTSYLQGFTIRVPK